MSYFLSVGVLLFVYMSVWFIFSVIKRRNDVADVAWGLGFVYVAWCSFVLGGDFDIRAFLVCFLVTVWGIRLSVHIFLRNKGKKEDYRYSKWRQDWGNFFYIRSYLQVFILQGFLLFLIILPVLIINFNVNSGLNYIDFIGVSLWVVGFFFEVVGDYQLDRFLKNPKNKGKLMTSGLWQYTRHPNYFGEVLCWWGVWLVALSVSYGWFGIIGPLTITVLILKVSGVPLLEKKMEEHPDFNDYKRRVSVFLPLPPKKLDK